MPFQVDGLRGCIERVVFVFDAIGEDFDDAETGWVVAERLADRAGDDHLQFPVGAVTVAVIVAGHDRRHAVLLVQVEIIPPRVRRHVEVLVFLVRLTQKQRMMLEDDDVRRLARLQLSQGFLKPIALCLSQIANGIGCVNDATVDADERRMANAEYKAVRPEGSVIPVHTVVRGCAADVVIARQDVGWNVPIESIQDAMELRRLGRVAWLMDHVASDDEEGGAETVDVSDGLREQFRFPLEVFVLSKHAELRIGHVNEEERFAVGRCRASSQDNAHRQPQHRTQADIHRLRLFGDAPLGRSKNVPFMAGQYTAESVVFRVKLIIEGIHT